MNFPPLATGLALSAIWASMVAAYGTKGGLYFDPATMQVSAETHVCTLNTTRAVRTRALLTQHGGGLARGAAVAAAYAHTAPIHGGRLTPPMPPRVSRLCPPIPPVRMDDYPPPPGYNFTP